ncbi:MAG: sulfatase [Deltaproteobacteria bacterium]|nr:sulfatase [Deltaproteobacteria bacterium]
MEERNIVIISLDEVRPDHLSCYGYQGVRTRHIDEVAGRGVRFETCISTADFTPIAMGTVITGRYPNRHGMRDPYCRLVGPSIGRILKERGYTTAGFVGNGLLAGQHGFADGFAFWNETSKETSWLELRYAGSDQVFYEGNYWVEELFHWLEGNHKARFFVWGHLYETHEGSEHALLRRGLIREGELAEFEYYDAKIRMADERLIGPLLGRLEELGIVDDTILVVMSDHGTNLGDRPARQIPWREEGKIYPQHTTMYDHDLKVAMIISGPGLPRGRVVRGMVGSVDLAPTLLDLVGISTEQYDFDGTSLLPAIERGEATGREIYSEDLFEPRGDGALQSIRTDGFKFIRNLTLGTEEF